ncbi:hypothetical protein ABK040_001955 [Willaertia magna]
MNLNTDQVLSTSDLEKEFSLASNHLLKLNAIVENKLKELKIKEEWFKEKELQIEECIKKASDRIKLNVGGKIFESSKETLICKKDTFFYAMLSSGIWQPDEKGGAYFIDRCPKLFHHFLDYLRYGECDLSNLTEFEKKKLKIEADFYCIDLFSNSVAINNNNTVDCFDLNEIGPDISLSNSNKTATKINKYSHSAVVGKEGVSEGKKTWKIKIDNINSGSHWICIGVVKRPLTTKKNSYIETWGISSANQRYPSGTTNASGDWTVGHVIQVDLDCDNRNLMVKNLMTGKSENWNNLPGNGTFYLSINLCNQHNGVTILE